MDPSWLDRVRAAGAPIHPGEAVRPFLAAIDAYAGALRDRGLDAWVEVERGGDAAIQLQIAGPDGKPRHALGWIVGRDRVHEDRATFSDAAAFEAHLVDEATSTGRFAWIAAGHAMERAATARSYARGFAQDLTGPFERADAVALVPGAGPDTAALRSRLAEALRGCDRFEAHVSGLLAVVDEFWVAPVAGAGVVWWMSPPSAPSWPEIHGGGDNELAVTGIARFEPDPP